MTDKLDGLIELVREAREENLALQAICAGLMAEIAILHKNPPEKLSNMVAGFQGAALGVADGVDKPTTAFTKVIDIICTMAEASLKAPQRRAES